MCRFVGPPPLSFRRSNRLPSPRHPLCPKPDRNVPPSPREPKRPPEAGPSIVLSFPYACLSGSQIAVQAFVRAVVPEPNRSRRRGFARSQGQWSVRMGRAARKLAGAVIVEEGCSAPPLRRRVASRRRKAASGRHRPWGERTSNRTTRSPAARSAIYRKDALLGGVEGLDGVHQELGVGQKTGQAVLAQAAAEGRLADKALQREEVAHVVADGGRFS